jgi:hypothetical protein
LKLSGFVSKSYSEFSAIFTLYGDCCFLLYESFPEFDILKLGEDSAGTDDLLLYASEVC